MTSAPAIAGLAIIASPSTSRHVSRIVAQLSGPVSTPGAEVSVVVTEFGAADLRGRTLHERRELLLAIAHLDHQDALFDAWSTVRNSTNTNTTATATATATATGRLNS